MEFYGNINLNKYEFESLALQAGSTSDRLALSPQVGQLFFDTTLQNLFVYKSTGWYAFNQDPLPIPPGIIMFTDDTVPTGWALCDGSVPGVPDLSDIYARHIPNSSTNPSLTPVGYDTHLHTGTVGSHSHWVNGSYTLSYSGNCNQQNSGGAGTASCGHTHMTGGTGFYLYAMSGSDSIGTAYNYPDSIALRPIMKT